MRQIDADELIRRIEYHREHVRLPDVPENEAANELYALAHDHIIDIVRTMPSTYIYGKGY